MQFLQTYISKPRDFVCLFVPKTVFWIKGLCFGFPKCDFDISDNLTSAEIKLRRARISADTFFERF